MKESTYKLIKKAANDFISGMIEELIAQGMFTTLMDTTKGASTDDSINEEIPSGIAH